MILIYHQSLVNMVQQLLALGSTAHSVKMREGPVLPQSDVVHDQLSPEAGFCGLIFFTASRTENGFTLSPNSFSRCSRRTPYSRNGKGCQFSIMMRTLNFCCPSSPVIGQLRAQHWMKPTPGFWGRGLRDLHPSIWDTGSQDGWKTSWMTGR